MWIGTALQLPRLLRNMKKGFNVSRSFADWFLLSYGLGIVATFPSFLRHLGASEQFLSAWWMNVFLLYPLIDSVRAGGIIIGETFVAACFALQYSLLILAIRRRSRDKLHQA